MNRKDRLAELQRDKTRRGPTGDSNIGYGEQPHPAQRGVEMHPLLAGNSDLNSTNQFLNSVSVLNDEVRSFQSTTLPKIKSLQSNLASTVDEIQTRSIEANLDAVNDDARKQIHAIKAKISSLEPSPRDPDFGIRKNQFSGLTTNFMNLLSTYRNTEIDFQRRQTGMLERQYRVANPNATQAEVDQAVANAEQGRPIFAQSLLQAMNRRDQASTTLDNVRARGEDVRKLARTIEELATLFGEIQALVEQQSKMIDQIEIHTEQAATELEAGVTHLDTGIESAKNWRKGKWICFGITIVVIIVVIIIILWQLHLIPSTSTASVPAVTSIVTLIPTGSAVNTSTAANTNTAFITDIAATISTAIA